MKSKYVILNLIIFFFCIKIVTIHYEVMIDDLSVVYVFLPLIASFVLGIQITIFWQRKREFLKKFF